MPMLQRTAEIAPSGSVRVLWAGSVAVELAPTGGIPFTEAGEPSISNDQAKNYSVSKTGNVLLAMETARRYHRDSIVSVAYNPGNLKTQLQRHMTWWQYAVARTILYPPTLGAYTMLFAGWSENMTLANSGAYVWPWGRIGALRRDICQAALAKTENGGEGLAERFWLWCEGKTAPYR
jgi:NAD(P)-dependent dehydrogenase (short-subunit alcohol dehydrogenase family)